MVQINDDFFEDLTPESTKALLKDLAEGKKVKVGPQTHQRNCEGPQGKTTLFEKPPGPQSVEFKPLPPPPPPPAS